MAQYSTTRHVINLLLILLGVWLITGGGLAMLISEPFKAIITKPFTVNLTIFLTAPLWIAYIADYISALGKQKDKEYNDRIRNL